MTGKQGGTLVNGRISEQYGRYSIVGGQLGGICRAIAYTGMRRITETDAESVEEAVQQLKSALDGRIAEQRNERERDVPTAVEFREAMEAIKPSLSEPLRNVLVAHALHRSSEATPDQLARTHPDWDRQRVETEYARLGRQLAKLLRFKPAESGISKSLAPILVIATRADAHRDRWRLRSEILAALDDLQSGHRSAGHPGERTQSLSMSD